MGGRGPAGARLVQGRVGFLGEPAEESRRQARLCARDMRAPAGNFADDGVAPVVGYAIGDRAAFDFVVGALRPRPVMSVVPAPPLAMCRQRNAARPVRERVHFDFAPQYRVMREQSGGVGWWLDSAALTPEETAAAIAAHAPDRAVV
ncbi:phosphotransferase [Streptomyces sp. B1866]|uniref:phosphotransferase n=1 Tax=Streptomyces sp. B1866 TaxID=3075431 RepID=UPI00288CF3AE|nr:phosphotransferase [Streptomyces sp. B1866]MDT3399707.1 phosphotransferase [Streptomyces sp. B1866]